ncbi:unnamed protein product [Rotaria magnacalcarata]|uniref:TRAF1-6 MATH domain-containing protein n=1 Tax=Rotaria magnacalcarata TaxID=392030 RepID=A0A819M5K7_9BILA|nr:unnamed protein product [Rotaria magnacalcarata]
MVGFNAKNLDCIESFYICNFCSLVLRKPVQLIDYGHRLCQSCANEQTGKLIRCSEHCEKAPRENNSDQNIDALKEVFQTINILSDGVGNLVGELKSLSTECDQLGNRLQTSIQESSRVHKSIEEQHPSIDDIKSKQEMIEQEIPSIIKKIDDMSRNSCDGTYTSRITNAKEKIAAAQSRTQPSIYSPPFYSSRTGYKMSLRLYLNGDGTAQKTHLSLFFVLMRNVRSNSFQRPRSNMNIASGIPKFAPSIFQQENNSYVYDNVMFIKVIVDSGNIPNGIIPSYVSS